MDNTPDTPPPPPGAPSSVPPAPKLNLSRPPSSGSALPPVPPTSGSPATKPTFKSAGPTSPTLPAAPGGTPRPATFAKPPSPTHAAHAPKVAAIEMNFLDEEETQEKLPLVLLDATALVASLAFATLLVLDYLILLGK